MKVICPNCGFERDVDKKRLTSAKIVATCPKCKFTFRLYSEDGSTELIGPSDKPGQAPSSEKNERVEDSRSSSERVSSGLERDGSDDPLPPGAIIPGISAPGNKDEKNAKGEKQAEDPEELRKNAIEAYKRQAERPDGDDLAPPLGNPWEKTLGDGRLGDFYQTCMRVMFAAPRFFSGLSPASSRAMAIYFFLVIIVFKILIERMWGGIFISALVPDASGDPQLQSILQTLAPETSIPLLLIERMAYSTLQLFFESAIFTLLFRLVLMRSVDFSVVFIVMAYSSAPALLCLVPVIGSVVGFIWSAACGFIGCRYALRISWSKTALALAPLYLMALFFIFYIAKALSSAN